MTKDQELLQLVREKLELEKRLDTPFEKFLKRLKQEEVIR